MNFRPCFLYKSSFLEYLSLYIGDDINPITSIYKSPTKKSEREFLPKGKGGWVIC